MASYPGGGASRSTRRAEFYAKFPERDGGGVRDRSQQALTAPPPSRFPDIDDVAPCSYIKVMKKVGIRELKNRLSHYVRAARAGQEIQVTDRGEAVAELLPPRRRRSGTDVRQRVADLARRGLATAGAPHDRGAYVRLRRLAPRGTAKRLLDQDRGDR